VQVSKPTQFAEQDTGRIPKAIVQQPVKQLPNPAKPRQRLSCSHIHQVDAGKDFHVRSRHTLYQAPNHLRPPSLPRQNVTANFPVQLHQLAVHCQRRALLDRVGAGFQLDQSVGVAGGVL
jgi:hypothetical protein